MRGTKNKQRARTCTRTGRLGVLLTFGLLASSGCSDDAERTPSATPVFAGAAGKDAAAGRGGDAGRDMASPAAGGAGATGGTASAKGGAAGSEAGGSATIGGAAGAGAETAGAAGAGGAEAPSCAVSPTSSCEPSGGATCCALTGALFDLAAKCWLGDASTPATSFGPPVVQQTIACYAALCIAEQAPGCYRFTRDGKVLHAYSATTITQGLGPASGTDAHVCSAEEAAEAGADVYQRPRCTGL